MNKDPFYQDILSILGQQLDGNLFERCVTDVFRHVYPTLVPIAGGPDAGMDGAIADLQRHRPINVICTTQKDVIGNLTRSLNANKRESLDRDRCVLITSQELTPRKRANLERRAKEMGFVLLNIHDRDSVADQLYGRPDWCKDLLGLTGAPSALSIMPPTRRPFLDNHLVGRDETVRWLTETEGDLLLVGQPGSGKTFLLHKVAKDCGWLFVVSTDMTEVANGVRQLKPTGLVIDDAHRDPNFLERLRYLRQQIHANVRIIANCWPGSRSDIAQRLDACQVRDLPLLDRDQLVEVIREVGIAGPPPLVSELVTQAAGKPGLAVTLSRLCLQEQLEDVILGNALLQDVTTGGIK